MLSKHILAAVLILGCVQVGTADRDYFNEYSTKKDEVTENPKYYSKEKKDFRKDQEWHEKKNKDVREQFENDYKKWNDKKYVKDNSKKQRDREFISTNEIDSNEYVDKFNKYGKVFYADEFEKNYKKSHTEESGEKSIEKSKTYYHDTDVNFLSKNKHISPDSELIAEVGNDFNKYKSKENLQVNYQNGNVMNIKREKKDFFENLKKIDSSNPPSPNDTISMARYIVHLVDWAAIGTISSRFPTKGAPFACLKAISDGPENASSGVPLFYMSGRDLCTQDILKDNRASVLVTLSETDYCKHESLDPQDPRCAKLTLSGKIKKIKPGSKEEKFAREALFSRHPVMKDWPSDHNWFFAKLKIGQIILLDHFGGAEFIKVKDYLNGGVTEGEL